jgi:hypothetical protein
VAQRTKGGEISKKQETFQRYALESKLTHNRTGWYGHVLRIKQRENPQEGFSLFYDTFFSNYDYIALNDRAVRE